MAAPLAWSQRRAPVLPNVPYDGRYTFVRLRYTQGYRMAWSADYPQMERNFMAILGDLSTLRLHRAGSHVHTLDDPALAHYPVAYLTEPGYWYPTDAEAAGLRNWILKGGFLIVDDFYFAQQWAVYDIGDYMEWSGEGWYPVNLSNDACKFATNYVVYGLTH